MVAGINRACRKEFQRVLHDKNVTINVFQLCTYVPLFPNIDDTLRCFTATQSKSTEWLISESAYIIPMIVAYMNNIMTLMLAKKRSLVRKMLRRNSI